MTTTEGTPMPDRIVVSDAEAHAMNARYIRGEITRESWEDWNRRRSDSLYVVDDTDPTGRVVGYVVLVFIALVVIGGPIVLAWLLGVKL
jgi:hypothetical protein